MKRILLTVGALLSIGALLVSCGSYNNSTGGSPPPKQTGPLALVSNPLAPTSSGVVPAINIIYASVDQPAGAISLALAAPDAGVMALSPNQKLTLVASPSNNSVVVVDNTTKSVAGSAISLGGVPAGLVISTDSTVGYVASPDALVSGQPSGLVYAISLTTGAITARIPVPGAHQIVKAHTTDRLLVFGTTNAVTIIDATKIGTNTDPRTVVQPFDHPVNGIISFDDSKAFILECGPECGGAAAAVTAIDLNSDTVSGSIPLANAGATAGILSNFTLYVAGTPPGTSCGSGTSATSCGTLTIINTQTMTVINTSPILISDGYHDHIEGAALGQRIFIGAHDCTNINIPASGGSPGEMRGCLSIYDVGSSSATVAPDNGNVTGVQGISGRQTVYVVQDGELRIYDTTTDKVQATQVNIVGQAVDVKLVD